MFSLSLTQASSCLTKSISFNLSSLVKIRPASYSFDVNFSSLYSSLVSHQAGAYTSFNSLKRLGVFSPPLSLDGMLVYRRVTPQQQTCQYPFTQLGGERHHESKVSCLRTQHNYPNYPGHGLNPDCSISESSALTISQPCHPQIIKTLWKYYYCYEMTYM